MTSVTYDHRAVKIGGKRELIISGAIHYPRSTPEMWPELLERSKAAGLNTIETYVFWNLHERTRGAYDFSGRLDLRRFCELIQAHGFHLIARLGPYICAETNYGGFPAWLRDVPGMKMRTWNEPFRREMGRWLHDLADYLRPMSKVNGGPLILAEIENEYNALDPLRQEGGMQYMEWVRELARSLELDVPWLVCMPLADCIETIHGFSGWPNLAKHFEKHPEQPALWTEYWPGWYNTFGYPRHNREPEDVAYCAARFFAGGGAGVNYYMWHAGTNFDRECMYLQTPDYGFNAPLDQYGLLNAKGAHLARLHQVLLEHAEAILQHERPTPQPLGLELSAFTYGNKQHGLTFLCNDGAEAQSGVKFDGSSYSLASKSVLMVENGEVLLDTAKVASADRISRKHTVLVNPLLTFANRVEPLPAERAVDSTGIDVQEPVEQLQFTEDKTDYCWYSSRFKVAPGAAGAGQLTLTRVADVAHVFVDGKFVASSPTPLKEDRGSPDSDGFSQTFDLVLAAGEHELNILCVAMGLIKHEVMLGFVDMVHERKGLWGPVRWRGEALAGAWRIDPWLAGEKDKVFASETQSDGWQMDVEAGRNRPLRWWRTCFRAPSGGGPYAIDLQGMNKGAIWLNGRHLARYWLVPATGATSDWILAAAADGNIGEPTQRYYHLPKGWIEEDNVLVLFEELGGDPGSVRLCRWG